MYLFQNWNWNEQVEQACSSTSSMTWFVTVTYTGDHIVVPKVCHLPDTYVASRQKMSRLVTSAGDSDRRSDNDGSSLRQSNATLTVKAVGTLVNKETTSRDTRAIPGDKICPAMKTEKSAEFLQRSVGNHGRALRSQHFSSSPLGSSLSLASVYTLVSLGFKDSLHP